MIVLAKKMSKFAQERAMRSKAPDKPKAATEDGSLRNVIIGNIVERKEGQSIQLNEVENVSFDDSEGFPKPKRIDKKVILMHLLPF